MGNELALISEIENEDIICDDVDLELLKPGAELDLVKGENESDGVDVPGDEDKGDKGDNKDKFDKLNTLIDKLPDNFLDAQPIIREDIAPQLIKLEGGLLEYYIDKLRKQTNVSKQTIKEEIKATKNIQDSVDSEDNEDDDLEDEETDPEVLEMANQISNNPLLLRNCIKDIQNLGVVRERRNIGFSICAVNSRLLIGEPRKSKTFNMKISGPRSSGKSHIILTTLDLYPKSSHIIIDGGSDMSIIYEKDVKHKALIITEAIQLESNNGADSFYAFVLRTIINDNFIDYKTTINTKQGRVTISIKLIGPTSLITTTTKKFLEKQLDDRLATVHPERSIEKTNEVIKMSGKRAAGKSRLLDEMKVKAWKHHNASLKPYNVIIPFAEKISDIMTLNSAYPESVHRGHNRFLFLIKSITIAYQYQRKVDEQGCLLAEYSDYFLAHQLMENVFRLNLCDERYTDKRIRYINKNGPMKPKDVAKAFDISGAAVTQWIKFWIEKSVLIWVDEKNNEFPNDGSLKKAKHSGKAFLKSVGTTGLPTTYQLTQDSRWDVGGEYYQRYDLELECLDKDENSDGSLKIHDDSYSDNDNIDDNGNSGKGVKVLNTISQKEINKMKQEHIEKSKHIIPDESEINKLCEEFGEEVGDFSNIVIPEVLLPV